MRSKKFCVLFADHANLQRSVRKSTKIQLIPIYLQMNAKTQKQDGKRIVTATIFHFAFQQILNYEKFTFWKHDTADQRYFLKKNGEQSGFLNKILTSTNSIKLNEIFSHSRKKGLDKLCSLCNLERLSIAFANKSITAI